MPSTMIHIVVAKKYDINASAVFLIGNIAPDAVYTREEKDKIHFRDKKDRFSALCEFALELDLQNEFNKGVLLHLYTDYCWDTTALGEYIRTIEDGNWFRPYRREIALAGGWLYHNTDWSNKVWEDMADCSTNKYEDGYGVDTDNVSWYINRTRDWHIENDIGPSDFFTPAYVEKFSNKVIVDFDNWLNELNSN